MNYGLPYMGSKNKIARDIVDKLPAAEYFVDLFCGGCAVTHAAMLSGKYQKFIINDINGQVVQFFVDAINGKYRDEKRWISREDFKRLKDTDAYVRTCWSFGTGGYSYIYGRKIESWKKALHYARVLGDFSFLKHDFGIDTNDASKRNIIKNVGAWELRDKVKYCQQSLKSLESLESLERLQRLQRLERPQSNLQTFAGDYQAVKIPFDAVVYCDPPYGGCSSTIDSRTYSKGFDIEQFINWLRTVKFLVYVSEYAMPDDFVSIWSKNKTCKLSSSNNNRKTLEHLFVHKRFAQKTVPDCKQLEFVI